MKYETAVSFRRALEDRLRNRAMQAGTPLVRLRKLVTFDRFLARLARIAPDRWVLKGALGLEFRFGERARMTMDVDLAGPADLELAASDLVAVQEVDLQDFFLFRVERSSVRVEGGAARYRADAELGGRGFETILIDAALPDLALEDGDEAELLRGPDLLGFAGIRPVEFPVIGLEQQIAEKVHAYTRRYGGDRPSGRVKDLVDLVVVASFARVNALRLRRALEDTFELRGRQVLPSSFAPAPPEWKAAYRRLAAESGVTADLEDGHSLAAALLDPALVGEANGLWDPAQARWVRND